MWDRDGGVEGEMWSRVDWSLERREKDRELGDYGEGCDESKLLGNGYGCTTCHPRDCHHCLSSKHV